jgi:hypothetical protein
LLNRSRSAARTIVVDRSITNVAQSYF